uniref:Uncharacterized protein n=1 Tax=Knipowitschia caucasica TaxID=637954 RepID=A0AAV2LIR2_KNICA
MRREAFVGDSPWAFGLFWRCQQCGGGGDGSPRLLDPDRCRQSSKASVSTVTAGPRRLGGGFGLHHGPRGMASDGGCFNRNVLEKPPLGDWIQG